MKPVSLCLLVLLCTAAISGQTADYVVRPDVMPCLNVREAPNSNADVLTCIPPGTRLTSSETVPYWRKVSLPDGRTGWAAKKFLIEPSAPADNTDSIPADAWLEVHFVDVGQGDGIWIHTFDDGLANGRFEGRNIVIDGGPDAADHKNELLKYIESRGHHGGIVDALIVSHPHDDHYPGAESILRHFDVRAYYDPGYPKDADRPNSSYQKFLATVPVGIRHVGRDSFGSFDWGSEIQAEILHSYEENLTGMGSGNTRENNASITLRLQYGEKVFLFMGDAEGKERTGDLRTPKYAEKVLLDRVPEKLKANVLKIAHHGSETSSTLPFIEAVSPDVLVVSSGRRNFGRTTAPRFLPDVSTLQRYCDHKPTTRIYRTDRDDESQGRTAANDADGDHIVIRTNGTELRVEAFADGVPITETTATCVP